MKFQFLSPSLLSVLLFTSSALNAEVFDFETVELDENQPYQQIRSDLLVSGNYQLKIEEGVIINDAYLSDKTDDGLSFHPSKGEGNTPLANNSLVSQRLRLSAVDGTQLFLCQFNIAEKKQYINLSPIKILGYFFEDGSSKTMEVIIELDMVSGYQRVKLDGGLWNKGFSRFDLMVQSESGIAGQLHFDDIVIEPSFQLCL